MLRSLITLLALCPALAIAQSDLMGRQVKFNVTTWDDPNSPYLISRDYVATVQSGPEFGLVTEGNAGLDVVPVLIDIGRQRIRLSYAGTPAGDFARANFNGYVLTFLTDCVLINDASIEQKGTSLPLNNDDLVVQPQSLGINVAGLAYAPSDNITIRLDVADCPLS